MARRAFYETLVGMVDTLRQMGEDFEDARTKLAPRPPNKVNKDLQNLAECIHKGRMSIIRAVNNTLDKPTVRQYLDLGEGLPDPVEELAAEVARLRLKLREAEDKAPTETAADKEAEDDSTTTVPNC